MVLLLFPNLPLPLLCEGHLLDGSEILHGLVRSCSFHSANSHCFHFHADGGVNPPQYYYSHEEIEAACRAAGVEPPPRYTAPEKTVTPAQLARDINIALGVPGMQDFYSIETISNILIAMSLATQYDVLSSRVSPTPIPTNGHYRAVEGMGHVVGSESQVAASGM